MRANGEEVHLCNHNPTMLGIMRVHTIQSGHCYCVTVCVWLNDVPLDCSAPMFVPKVELGEQRVKDKLCQAQSS